MILSNEMATIRCQKVYDANVLFYGIAITMWLIMLFTYNKTFIPLQTILPQHDRRIYLAECCGSSRFDLHDMCVNVLIAF